MSMNEFFTQNRGNSPTNRVRSTRCSLAGSDHETLSHAEQETLPENVFNHDFLSDVSTPSPKPEGLSSNSGKSNDITSVLSAFGSDLEPTEEKIGEDFSLDGIVCSIGDEIGNTEQNSFRKNGFDNEIDGANSGDIPDQEVKIKKNKGKTVLNNNQSRRPDPLSPQGRKRKFSSTISNEGGSELELSEVASPAKKGKQKRLNEAFQSSSLMPSTMRTRQQKNSVMKNSSDEDDSEGATITQQFDISDGE